MSKDQNRQTMPIVASLVDNFRDIFGQDLKVTYAKENGREVGKKDTDPGIPMSVIQLDKIKGAK